MKSVKDLLGKKIKELRIKKGLSQQQLAELINIDQRNLSNIECGNTFPAKSLDIIAQKLNISLTELFDFEYLSKDEEEMKKYIVNRLENLNNNEIKFLYRIMRNMQ